MKSQPNNSNDEIILSSRTIGAFLTLSCSKAIPFRFRAKGESMAPFIKNNDIITIVPYLDKEPALGDIAAFIHPESNQLLIHRIVKKQSTCEYIFKGDNNRFIDDTIDKRLIPGYVKEVKLFNKLSIKHGSLLNKIISWLSKSGLLFYLLKITRQTKKYILKVS